MIEQEITLAVLKAVKELYGQEVPEKMAQLQKTRGGVPIREDGS